MILINFHNKIYRNETYLILKIFKKIKIKKWITEIQLITINMKTI